MALENTTLTNKNLENGNTKSGEEVSKRCLNISRNLEVQPLLQTLKTYQFLENTQRHLSIACNFVKTIKKIFAALCPNLIFLI